MPSPGTERSGAPAAPQLKEAVESGDQDRVADLLAAGASLVLDDRGLTALHHAVRQRDRAMARFLLECGADEYVLLGTTWPHVKSPLLEAVKWGDVEMVDLLVAYAARRSERGPEVSARGGNAALPGLKVASERSAGAHVKLQEQLDGALLAAAAGGHAEVVAALLRNGANVNCYPWGDDKRRRPLVTAAAAGFRDVVAVLIEGGAAVDAEEDGRTALHRAVAAGREDVVRLLLTAGARVDSVDETGGTPLHTAAAKGFGRIAELLLAHDADPNAQNNRIETPLYLAPRGSDVALLLRRHGGKVRPFWKGLFTRAKQKERIP